MIWAKFLLNQIQHGIYNLDLWKSVKNNKTVLTHHEQQPIRTDIVLEKNSISLILQIWMILTLVTLLIAKGLLYLLKNSWKKTIRLIVIDKIQQDTLSIRIISTSAPSILPRCKTKTITDSQTKTRDILKQEEPSNSKAFRSKHWN